MHRGQVIRVHEPNNIHMHVICINLSQITHYVYALFTDNAIFVMVAVGGIIVTEVSGSIRKSIFKRADLTCAGKEEIFQIKYTHGFVLLCYVVVI